MTSVDINQLQARTGGKTLLVGEDFIVTAQLGTGLAIDWATSPATINAVTGGAVATKRLVYRPTVPTADFKIPEAFVSSSMQVYSNGLLQAPGSDAEGADYRIVDSMVHFHPRSVPQAGWTVQLLYQPLE